MNRPQGQLLETLQLITQQYINGLEKAYMISNQKIPFSQYKLKTNLMNFLNSRVFPLKVQPDIPNMMDMSHEQQIPFNVKFEDLSQHQLSLISSKNYVSSYKSSKKDSIQNLELQGQNLLEQCFVKEQCKNNFIESHYSQTVYHKIHQSYANIKDQNIDQNIQESNQQIKNQSNFKKNRKIQKNKTISSIRQSSRIKKQSSEVKIQSNSIKSVLRKKEKVQYQNQCQKQISSNSQIVNSLDRSSNIKRQYQSLMKQKRNTSKIANDQKIKQSQIQIDKGSNLNDKSIDKNQDQIQVHSLSSQQSVSSSFHINQINKNKYNSYSKEFKSEVINLAKQFDVQHCHELTGVPKKSILRWIKRSHNNKFRTRGRKPIDPQMQKKLNEWLSTSIKNGLYKTQRQIRQAAVSYSNDKAFKASKGWLQKYFKRNTYITQGLYRILEQRRDGIKK